MAGDDKAGANLFAQLCSFFGAEVAGYAAPEVEPIDGEQGKIDLPIPKSIHQTVIRDAIAAVIDRPGAGSHDKTDETVIPVLILLEHFMGRRDGVEEKRVDLNRLAIGADGSYSFRWNPQAVCGEM